VPSFSNVSLSGSGQVILEQTANESLTVTTDDNLLPYIKTEVKGNRLEVGFTDSMTNLRRLRVSRGASLRSSSAANSRQADQSDTSDEEEQN
jgi:hypothetical protein